MAFHPAVLVRRLGRQLCSAYYYSSSSSSTSVSAPQYRSAVNNIRRCTSSEPDSHTQRDVGSFYSPSVNDYKSVYSNCTKTYRRSFVDAVDDRSILIREPGVEVIDHLRHADLSLPVKRYVFWGDRGTGKSLMLGHVMHWAKSKGWVIAHLAEPYLWWKYQLDRNASTFKKERIDFPTRGAQWLSHFARMNKEFLKGDDPIRIDRKVVWNLKEEAAKGTTLQEIVDFGLLRPKYSCDCVGVVLRELTTQANKTIPPVMVAIDCVNSLWKSRTTSKLSFARVSLVQHFRAAVSTAWSGGAVVCVTSEQGGRGGRGAKRTQPFPHELVNEQNFESLDPFVPPEVPLGQIVRYTPQELLGDNGFRRMDPFLPVHVPRYSRAEALSVLDFYSELGWIASDVGRSQSGREEILFLSDLNPHSLHYVSYEW